MGKKDLLFKSIKPNIYPKRSLSWVRSGNRHIEFNSKLSYEEIDKYVEYLEKDLLWIRIKKASRQEFKSSDIKLGRKKNSSPFDNSEKKADRRRNKQKNLRY